jgi:hypothetical protein
MKERLFAFMVISFAVVPSKSEFDPQFDFPLWQENNGSLGL